MPTSGCTWKPQEAILRYEEIVAIVYQMARLGVRKLRITGGEPLVRQNLVGLVAQLTQVPGIEEVALSTNGLLLERYAEALKAAGLSRINISLDTLDPAKFTQIARLGSLEAVLYGIHAAQHAGLNPVKLNCVLLRGINDDEIDRFALLTLMFPLHVRFIELMPLGNPEFFRPDRFLSVAEAREKCEVWGELMPAHDLAGSGPATTYRYRNGLGTIGFIGALTCSFCHRCNRLRLTSDGWLRPCLDSRTGVNLRDPLRCGASSEELEALARQAVEMKPESHHMSLTRWQDDPTTCHVAEGDPSARQPTVAALRQGDRWWGEFETMCAVGG